MEKIRIEHSTGLRSFVLAAATLVTASMIADCSGGGASMPGPFVAQTSAPCTPPCVAAEYLVPGSTGLGEITAGPDGNVWFTGATANGGQTGIIGKLTTAGAIMEFSLGSTVPIGISAGPGGDLSFTARARSTGHTQTGTIGKITTAGAVTWTGAYPGTELQGIALGSDGNVWFAEFYGSHIGKVDSVGHATLYYIGSVSAAAIAAGPDGGLWFTEDSGSGGIGRITTAGVVTHFTLPATSAPKGITAGPDGHLWFTEQSSNKIGRITTAGIVTEFAIPTANCRPRVYRRRSRRQPLVY